MSVLLFIALGLALLLAAIRGARKFNQEGAWVRFGKGWGVCGWACACGNVNFWYTGDMPKCNLCGRGWRTHEPGKPPQTCQYVLACTHEQWKEWVLE